MPAGITQKVASIENFVVAQVDGKTARLEGRTPDGQVLEIVELNPAAISAPSR